MNYPSNILNRELTRPEQRRDGGAPWAISRATHQLAQEADATMSPDGWEADYASPAGVPAGPEAATHSLPIPSPAPGEAGE